MAIINKNQIVIAGTNRLATMSETRIVARISTIDNNKVGSFKVTAQVGFFADEASAYESVQNAINVVGFEKEKRILEFDVPVAVVNNRYVIDLYAFDVALKAHMLKYFPTWDESLLELTTEPIVE